MTLHFSQIRRNLCGGSGLSVRFVTELVEMKHS